MRAGRLMLEEISNCVRLGESFGFETTLSGLGYISHIQRWRSKGFHVSLFYLMLSSVDIAIARVAERVIQGGHGIPESVIRRRYESGKRNFEERYKWCVDAWALYDNTGAEPFLVEWGENK